MYSGGPHAAAKSQKCRTCSPNSPSWARQSRERRRTQENRRSPDSGPLPSDAAGTAPPPFLCDLKGSARSLHNGTAKGKRRAGSVPGTGRPDCSSGIARGAGPDPRPPDPPVPPPRTGAGAGKTQGTHRTRLPPTPSPARPRV